MNHLIDLQCTLYTDGALDTAEASEMADHLASCAHCRARIQAYAGESALIRAALMQQEAVPIATVPKFSKGLDLKTFAFANLATGLVLWTVQFLWKTLFGELIVNIFTEITSIYVPNAYELIVAAAMYVYREGTTMIDTYLGLIVLTAVVLGVATLALRYRRARTMVGLGLGVVLGASLVAPTPAHALDFRFGEDLVNITAGETIADTLVIGGESVIIDGNVEGDLITGGERLVINGSVSGNVIALGQSVTINGNVGGTVIGAAEVLELSGAQVVGDIWVAGETIELGKGTRIGRNATVAGERIILTGHVTRDLTVAGESLEVSGSVGEDIEAFTDQLRLIGDASVGGDIRFRSDDEDRLQQSPDATVQGSVTFSSVFEESEPRNRYLDPQFYINQVLGLVAAFVAGVTLLWFFPDLRYLRLGNSGENFRTAGLGLIGIISLPVVAILMGITVVGLPLTVVGLFFWAFMLYFAKIVLASYLGQVILVSSDQDDSLPLTLLAGLGAIFVAVNIPAVGGIINLLLTIIGVGMILRLMLRYVRDLDEDQLTG